MANGLVRTRLYFVALAALAPRTEVAAKAQNVEYNGFIIDNYCWNLNVEAGAPSALDRAELETRPGAHSLHCLRDVPVCTDWFFLAEKHGSKYRPKFLLDESSYQNALNLLKSRSDNPRNVVVTARGTHRDNDGVLRDATFVYCSTAFSSNATDGVCDSTCVGDGCSTPADLELNKVPARILLWLHAICMSLSWGFLLPLGVVSARYTKATPKKIHLPSCFGCLGVGPFWFNMHRVCQVSGVLLSTLGFIFVLAFRKKHHFMAFKATPHEEGEGWTETLDKRGLCPKCAGAWAN